jgi:hypothetical protein
MPTHARILSRAFRFHSRSKPHHQRRAGCHTSPPLTVVLLITIINFGTLQISRSLIPHGDVRGEERSLPCEPPAFRASRLRAFEMRRQQQCTTLSALPMFTDFSRLMILHDILIS